MTQSLPASHGDKFVYFNIMLRTGWYKKTRLSCMYLANTASAVFVSSTRWACEAGSMADSGYSSFIQLRTSDFDLVAIWQAVSLNTSPGAGVVQ